MGRQPAGQGAVCLFVSGPSVCWSVDRLSAGQWAVCLLVSEPSVCWAVGHLCLSVGRLSAGSVCWSLGHQSVCCRQGRPIFTNCMCLVSPIMQLQVPILQSRFWHNAAAFTVSPEQAVVVVFGGCPHYPTGCRADTDLSHLADTTLLRFSELLN